MVGFFPSVIAGAGAKVAAATAAKPAAGGGFFGGLGDTIGGLGEFAVGSLDDILQAKLEIEKAKAFNKLGGNPAPDNVPRYLPGRVPSYTERQQSMPLGAPMQSNGAAGVPTSALLIGGGVLALVAVLVVAAR